MLKLTQAQSILEKGQALILPTETVYGLFAKAMEESAVDLVYALKERPRDKAMNLNVASYQDILAFSQDQPSYLKALYDAFLPGPLTIILKANEAVPSWINSGMDTVGFRLPDHPITRQLICATGPLIGPSANKSGHPSGIRFDQIKQQFDNSLDGIADDFAIKGLDSTILDLSGPRAKILRQGSITKDHIIAKVPDIKF